MPRNTAVVDTPTTREHDIAMLQSFETLRKQQPVPFALVQDALVALFCGCTDPSQEKTMTADMARLGIIATLQKDDMDAEAHIHLPRARERLGAIPHGAVVLVALEIADIDLLTAVTTAATSACATVLVTVSLIVLVLTAELCKPLAGGEDQL
jgi:hypothetical protein